MVYAIVRQAVLEQQVKSVSQIYLNASQSHFSDSETDDDVEEKSKEILQKMPKVNNVWKMYMSRDWEVIMLQGLLH